MKLVKVISKEASLEKDLRKVVSRKDLLQVSLANFIRSFERADKMSKKSLLRRLEMVKSSLEASVTEINRVIQKES